jgi:hypothetical protein
MTIPKWLLPAISLFAALVVGAAAAVVGFQFASRTTTTQAAPTITVPLLSPSSVGIPPKAGTDGSYAASSSNSKVTVVKPGSVGAGGIDPALQRDIDALNPRPGATPTSPATTGAAGHADPTPAPAPPGDTCSATPIPPTCPGGVPAVVIGDQTSLAPLAVFATAYPPTVAASRRDAACPSQTAGDTDLPVAFSVNHVADVTLNYFAVGSPTRILSLTLHPTTDQEDEFTTALAAYTGPAGTFTHLINLCTVLPNLAQGVPFQYHAIARDSNGQTAVTDGLFQLRDLAQRPPTKVTPVGRHTVNITAARASGQAMQFTVYGLPDGVDPTCAAAHAHGGVPLHELPGGTNWRDPAWFLTQNHWDTGYAFFESHTFAVPSNARIVACVLWYNAGEQYTNGTPLFYSQEALNTPSVAYPTLKVVQTNLNASVPRNGAHLSLDFTSGMACGAAQVPAVGLAARGRTPDYYNHTESAVICTLTDSLAAAQDPNDVVTLHEDVQAGNGPEGHGDGVHSTRDVALPYFDEWSCPFSEPCDAPMPQYFTVPLGYGAGDIGTALLELTWNPTAEQLAGLAAGRWTENPVVDADYVSTTAHEISVAQAETVHLTNSPSGSGMQMSYHLITSEPVSWEAELEQNSCGIPAGRTLSANQARPSSDSTVVIDGLCPGAQYLLRLALHGADGTTTVWQHLLNGRFWSQGIVTVPGVAGHMILTSNVTGPSSFSPSDFRLTVGDLSESNVGTQCIQTFRQTTHDLGEIQANWQTTRSISLLTTDCNTGHLLRLETNTGEVTLAELERGVTITVDPSTGWSGTFFLVFRPNS